MALVILLGAYAASQVPLDTDSNSYNLATEEAIANYQTFVDQLGEDTVSLDILILEKTDG